MFYHLVKLLYFCYKQMTKQLNYMTNISKRKTSKNVHSHIDKAFAIIDDYLPFPYVDKVQKLVKGSAGTIRNVKSQKKGNIKIIEALLKVALENKKQIEKNNKAFESLLKM